MIVNLNEFTTYIYIYISVQFVNGKKRQDKFFS